MSGARATSTELRLRMRDVQKRFGAARALRGVSLEVAPGEVHALVGENGAGKSTLMKILAGALAPDAGQMWLDGAAYAPRLPLDALDRGVAMIYQELNLAPHLRVWENLHLGREPRRFGVVRRSAARARARAALVALGHADLDVDAPVSTLGPATRQVVEVARALVHEARVVVMDEPTSSLSHLDAERLFDVVRRLAERGVSVVYISHFLEEVKRIADRYTVLRDGETVAAGPVEGTETRAIVEQMVGRPVAEVFPRVEHARGEPLLALDRLAGPRLPREATLRLHRGEILGIAGLVGAGRTELVRAVFGLDEVRSGRVTVAGVEDRGRSPGARLAQGVGMLSENRKEEGLATGRSIAENTTLSRLGPLLRYGVIDTGRRRAATRRWIDALRIKCRDPDQRVAELSGGNQQKVAIARLLHHDVDVLLLDEPTRGVDVGSKVEIYRLIGDLAARGKAVLFVSSHLPELVGVCDRIAVMHRGVLGEVRAASAWSEAALLDEATRGPRAAEGPGDRGEARAPGAAS